MAAMVGQASAGDIATLAGRLEAVEGRIAALEADKAKLSDENRALRLYGGGTRALAMTAIVGLARVEIHVGLAPPQRKKPLGPPLKMFAIDSGWSESGLRRQAQAAQAAGRPFAELTGGKWFIIDPALAPPKRRYERRKSSD